MKTIATALLTLLVSLQMVAGKVIKIQDIEYEPSWMTIKEDNNLLIQNSVDDDTINSILVKQEKSRTVSDLQKIIKRKEIDDWYEDKKKEYDDYKDLIVKSYKGNQSPYTYLNPVFTDSGNNIVQTYEEVLSRQLLREAISKFKSNLSSTDYMIIKTYEAKINNEDAPYSSDRMDEVMEERKNYREKINELELLLDKAK